METQYKYQPKQKKKIIGFTETTYDRYDSLAAQLGEFPVLG